MKILSLEKFNNNKYKKDENWIEERNSSFFSLFRVRSEFCQKRKQRQNSWRIPYKLKIYRFFVLNSLKFLKNWSRNFWIRRLWFLLISTNWLKIEIPKCGFQKSLDPFLSHYDMFWALQFHGCSSLHTQQPHCCKWMVFTHNLSEDQLIPHTCKIRFSLPAWEFWIWLNIYSSPDPETNSKTPKGSEFSLSFCLIQTGSTSLWNFFSE